MAAFDPFENFAYAVVTGVSGDDIDIDNTAPFPDPATDGEYWIIVWSAGVSPVGGSPEIARVTAKSGTTLSLTRGEQGTTPRSLTVGDQVMLGLTRDRIKQIEDATRKNIYCVDYLMNGDGYVYFDVTTVTGLGPFTDNAGNTLMLSEGDRVLVGFNSILSDTINSGIYIASAGAWVRADDWTVGDTRTVGIDLIYIGKFDQFAFQSYIHMTIYDPMGSTLQKQGVIGTDAFLWPSASIVTHKWLLDYSSVSDPAWGWIQLKADTRINMNTNQIKSLGDPTDAQDAVTKAYATKRSHLYAHFANQSGLSGYEYLQITQDALVGTDLEIDGMDNTKINFLTTGSYQILAIVPIGVDGSGPFSHAELILIIEKNGNTSASLAGDVREEPFTDDANKNVLKTITIPELMTIGDYIRIRVSAEDIPGFTDPAYAVLADTGTGVFSTLKVIKSLF